MPLQATSGAASYDGFGGGVAAVPNYIEDVFSTYLYTGNGSTQTITNGIDLSTKGGLVWVKSRTNAFADHALSDTANGTGKYLSSNTTSAQTTTGNNLTAFNVDGFTVGSRTEFNQTSANLVSWTFRKQPKFFDVVTYTGDGTSSRNIAHALGSTPGCVIVKRTDSTGDWVVWHRSISTFPKSLLLNSTVAAGTSTTYQNGYILSTSSTTFSVEEGTDTSDVNASGGTYVAYLFAHNAGGFGLTGTDNVISCGSFTSDALGQASITLGYEPQWVMIKRTDGTSNWTMLDNMRGWAVTSSGDAALQANTSNAETSGTEWGYPTATGFSVNEPNGSTNWIYIAIRRGPMKVPTDATKVFYPNAYTGNSTDTTITSTGFPPDLFFSKIRQSDNGYQNMMFDKLRGSGQYLIPTSTDAEGASSNIQLSFNMTGVTLGVGSNVNNSGNTYAQWNFRRAPSFFDEVCYTGTGSNMTISHNLGVVPELMIVKMRSTATFTGYWYVYASGTGNTKYGLLSLTNSFSTSSGAWNNTTPTASSFYVGTDFAVSESGKNFVAYLFATCPGVSKVGSYTGNGTTQAIACGFTGGARFVLIKRTDSTGGWYVYDTARGMTTLTDPYLLLNSTAAESATLGSVTTVSTGFAVNASILAAINTNAASYIFLAIA